MQDIRLLVVIFAIFNFAIIGFGFVRKTPSRHTGQRDMRLAMRFTVIASCLSVLFCIPLDSVWMQQVPSIERLEPGMAEFQFAALFLGIIFYILGGIFALKEADIL